MGGRKDLGGADSAAHAGNVQQVPAAQLLEHAASTQGVQQVTPGHDHTGYPGKFDSLLELEHHTVEWHVIKWGFTQSMHGFILAAAVCCAISEMIAV
jgi:hypothetical protein